MRSMVVEQQVANHVHRAAATILVVLLRVVAVPVAPAKVRERVVGTWLEVDSTSDIPRQGLHIQPIAPAVASEVPSPMLVRDCTA